MAGNIIGEKLVDSKSGKRFYISDLVTKEAIKEQDEKIDNAIKKMKLASEESLNEVEKKLKEVKTVNEQNKSKYDGTLELLDRKIYKYNSYIDDQYGPNGNSTHRCPMKISFNKFGLINLLTSGNNASKTESTINVFDVDETTGKIINHQLNRVWTNGSGRGISTTKFLVRDFSNKFFYIGNNCWPGQSSNQFGYGYGVVNENNNGLISNGGTANQNYCHSNGNTLGVSDGGNSTSLYGIVNSYYRGDSRARIIRVNFISSSLSLYIDNPSSNTSTNYNVSIIDQPGISSPIAGMDYYRDGSNNWYLRVYNLNGSNKNYRVYNYGQNSYGFLLDNGNILFYDYNTRDFYLYSSYTNRSLVNNKVNMDFYSLITNSNMLARYVSNVGKNTWLIFNYNLNMIFTLYIDPTTLEVKILDKFDLSKGIEDIFLNFKNSNIVIKTAGTKHQFLVIMDLGNNKNTDITVVKNPLQISNEE